jgi:hypothetical protein
MSSSTYQNIVEMEAKRQAIQRENETKAYQREQELDQRRSEQEGRISDVGEPHTKSSEEIGRRITSGYYSIEQERQRRTQGDALGRAAAEQRKAEPKDPRSSAERLADQAVDWVEEDED